MSKLTLHANAKVNLALDVLGICDEDGPHKGYHFIQTVFHEITPQNTHDFKPDIVTIEAEDSEKETDEILIDSQNTAHKAATLILAHQKAAQLKPQKITIHIEKNIPISSGLGGGSSDATAVLKGMNALLELNLSVTELESLAAEIGMDVPFFIQGGVALGEHFGEKITNLPEVKGVAFVLSTPATEKVGQSQKTTSAYATLDLSLCGKNQEKTAQLIHAIKTNDHLAMHALLHNDFETLARQASDQQTQPLPQNHHLTGSGPTIFIMA